MPTGQAGLIVSIAALARPEIVAMKPYSSARSEADSTGILLNANESPWPLVDDPGTDECHRGELNRYPEPQHAGLIKRFASLYDLPSDHVLLTRGSDDGIDLLVRVFCRAGHDAILDCPPSFGMYRIAAQTQGALITSISRIPDSLELDTRRILDAARQANPPRLIFLTSPANPTGDLVGPEFLIRLLEVTAGRSVVVVDEAYAEFAASHSFTGLIRKYEHLVVLRTLSKAFASAALRCGALLAQPGLIDLLKRVMPPYPIATPVLNLALKLFEPESLDRQKTMLRKFRKNKSVLIDSLSNRPFVEKVWPGKANFVLARVSDAKELVDHLASNRVTVRQFPVEPLLKNCIRISVGKTSELDKLASALDAYAFEPANRQVEI